MQLSRRAVLTGLTSAAALSLAGCGANGDQFPSHSVEMTVGFGAGGLNDTVGRFFARALEAELGERVLVVNRPGGGGIIAATEARNARPDGYQAFLAPVGAFTSGPLLQTVGYSLDDFRSVTAAAATPNAVVISAQDTIASIDELREQTGELSYAVLGNGNPTHVVGARIAQASQFTGRFIPYDASGEALISVANGEVKYGVTDLPSVPPMIRSGDIRLLAVTTPERLEAFPDIPTTTEAGIPDSSYMASQGLCVPRDTDEDIISTLSDAGERAVRSKEYQEFLSSNHLTVPEVKGDKFLTEFMPTEQQRYREAFQDLGIQSRRR